MTSRDRRFSRHCAVEFQALPARIGQVRRIVSAQLRFWHLHPLIDRVALGVTELLANVHQHAGPDKHCTVEMVFLRDRLIVSVRDHDPQLPDLRQQDALATSGRGLALVAALSDSWGIREHHDGSGKVVWFTLPAPFTAPSAAPSPDVYADAGAGRDVLTCAADGPGQPPVAEGGAWNSPATPFPEGFVHS